HHADKYGIAPERLAALGDSAGGHLVSLLGMVETRNNDDAELASYSSRVNAVVDIFGPSDLTRSFSTVEIFGITVQGMVDNFVGRDLKRQREASPLYQVTSNAAPFLIFHGGKDALVAIDHSRQLHSAL